jgi:hypothetical protein
MQEWLRDKSLNVLELLCEPGLNPIEHLWRDLKIAVQQLSTSNLYSTHREAYKAPPHPPFGKSDHNSILLILAYKQKLKQEAAMKQSIKKWSDEADAKLQDYFASTD